MRGLSSHTLKLLLILSLHSLVCTLKKWFPRLRWLSGYAYLPTIQTAFHGPPELVIDRDELNPWDFHKRFQTRLFNQNSISQIFWVVLKFKENSWNCGIDEFFAISLKLLWMSHSVLAIEMYENSINTYF